MYHEYYIRWEQKLQHSQSADKELKFNRNADCYHRVKIVSKHSHSEHKIGYDWRLYPSINSRQKVSDSDIILNIWKRTVFKRHMFKFYK